jgi:hypothetical protein
MSNIDDVLGSMNITKLRQLATKPLRERINLIAHMSRHNLNQEIKKDVSLCKYIETLKADQVDVTEIRPADVTEMRPIPVTRVEHPNTKRSTNKKFALLG